jgi:3-methyladenine DNA glycosylase AlkD
VVKRRSTNANQENISNHELAQLENEIVARLLSLRASTTESIRTVRREVSKRLVKTSARSTIALALRLTRRQTVPRFFAYELVQHHSGALHSLKAKSLEDFGRGNDNWGAVDAFACYLAGPVWRERQVSDALIRRWARSRDRWWRRTALVSTVPLNSKARGGSGDALRTLNICELLVTDRDDMVVKALSWALRALSKRDPQSVRKFLNEHRAVLAPRVAREVSNKLQTGLKNPHASKAHSNS